MKKNNATTRPRKKRGPEKNASAPELHLPALFNDPYLGPYAENFLERAEFISMRRRQVLGSGNSSLEEIADWHLQYGLHRLPDGNWRFREWLPDATGAQLLGEFNDWTATPWFELHPEGDGNWVVEIPASMLRHGQSYQLHVEWHGGTGWRLPSAVRCLKREENSNGSVIFNARIWEPETPYQWKHDAVPMPAVPIIYEAHTGIAQSEARVGTFDEFRKYVLPRIAAGGYTCVQFMAVASHPYYGSFGYHVANFFAPCDLFGTPDDFKALVDEAHGLGLRVIMDLVHSHSVKNELEGLGRLCGDQTQFFHSGARGEHSAWDSYCFNYGKTEVCRMLLSNCRYWLDEFHLDGFRFDGVTSMLYFDHGLGRAFTSYADYFSPNVDWDSVAYLTMANEICHSPARKRNIWTIAEDVSGMPGLAMKIRDGGIGFDYRLAMGVTDYWFKLLDIPDEYWDIGNLWHELTNRRKDEKTISYVECHDQAIVGGQSFIYRCIGPAMYDAMDTGSSNMMVSRGIALHKMARLVTAATAGSGYMNFIGNEFGHPEWLDLPREGNCWSYDHARRRWDLCDNPKLRFGMLRDFDAAMLKITAGITGFYEDAPEQLWLDSQRHILAFRRGGLIFCFNFHPSESCPDFPLPIPNAAPAYKLILDSDAGEYDGEGRVCACQRYITLNGGIRIYLPTRTALVLAADDKIN